jgi:hypothetical protein
MRNSAIIYTVHLTFLVVRALFKGTNPIMCFSATASFAVAAALIPSGLYAITKARGTNPRHVAFAAFPLAFGVQQLFEGMVWLQMGGHTSLDRQAVALGFTFFSHFFWLLWVPLSVWALERRQTRRRLNLAVVLIGALFGASLYIPLHLYDGWLDVVLTQGSIKYKATLIYDGVLSRLGVRAIYAILIVAPLIFCSERYIQLFGVLVALTVAAAVVFYGYAFISVWCYFAAVLSLYVVFAVPRLSG